MERKPGGKTGGKGKFKGNKSPFSGVKPGFKGENPIGSKIRIVKKPSGG
ncbi:MAG: hypothetical protein PHX37_04795 [Eubacteriales bacterium]|nr:hypothetical protein [Eubacteriales bacterium]